MKNFKINSAYFIIRYCLVCLISITGICILFYSNIPGFKFEHSYNKIFDSSDLSNSIYEDIATEFNNESSIFIIIEGNEEDNKNFIEYLKPRLEGYSDWVNSVRARLDSDFFKKNFFKIIDSKDIDDYKILYSDPNLLNFTSNLNNYIYKQIQDTGTYRLKDRSKKIISLLNGIDKFIEIQNEIIDGRNNGTEGQRAFDEIAFGERYELSFSKDLLLAEIEPKFNSMITEDSLIIILSHLNDIVKKTKQEYGVNANLYSDYIIQNNIQKNVFSVDWLLILICVLATFPLTLIYTKKTNSFFILLISVLLSMTCSIGILLLLGIQFNHLLSYIILYSMLLFAFDSIIQLMLNYYQKRYLGFSFEMSIVESISLSTKSILITSLVFFLSSICILYLKSTSFNNFFYFFGASFISISVISIISGFLVLVFFEKYLDNNNVYRSKDIFPKTFSKIMIFGINKGKIFNTLIILITGFLTYNTFFLKLDHNYYAFYDLPTKQQHLQKRLLDDFNFFPEPMYITSSDISDIRQISDTAMNLDVVGRVSSITNYLPDENSSDKRFRMIDNIRRKMNSTELRKDMSKHDLLRYKIRLEELERNIINLQETSFIEENDRIFKKTVQLVGGIEDTINIGVLTNFINDFDAKFNTIYLTYFQQQFSNAFKKTVLNMANLESLNLSDLPIQIKTPYINSNEELFLATIYPAKNIWENNDLLKDFVSQIKNISPNAIGLPLIYLELINILNSEGKVIILWFMVLAFLILSILFKNIKYAFICIFSMISVLVWAAGIFEILNISISWIQLLSIPFVLVLALSDYIQILNRLKNEKNLDIVYRITEKIIVIKWIISMLIILNFSIINFYFAIQILYVVIYVLAIHILILLFTIPALVAKDSKIKIK